MQDCLRPRFYCGCGQLQKVTVILRMCQTSSLMLPSWAAAQEASAVKLLEVRSQILETCIIESVVPSPEFSQQEQCIVSYVTLGETAVLQSESFSGSEAGRHFSSRTTAVHAQTCLPNISGSPLDYLDCSRSMHFKYPFQNALIPTWKAWKLLR